jgi:starch synthase
MIAVRAGVRESIASFVVYWYNRRMTKPRKLKILFVGTEAAPFAKVGGLGEVLFALPRAMRKLGHDVRVFIPKYARIKTRKYPMEKVASDLRLMRSEHDPYGLTVANVLRHTAKDESVTYFLENMEYYEKRANVYGYDDDTARWILLSRGVLEFLRQSDWMPDVIVANDWATGFIPNLLATEYKRDPVLSRIATVFLIHNLRHQGTFDTHFVRAEDADSGRTTLPDPLRPDATTMNGMRRGILYADLISTVSPTYAKEILTPDLGEKLDGILRERRDRLVGVLNGMDYVKYNPSRDKLIKHRYSASRPQDRVLNKLALQRKFDLPRDPGKFILGWVGRMDEQKGINLFMQVAPALFENIDFQLVVVGTGEKDYRMFFADLKEAYPDRVGTYLYYDEKRPKHIFAGADAILIPSRFEPAGLVQMEAMRYGCIPIVRKTGGLADTVEDHVPGEGKGTGFLFTPYEPMALLIAIVRAYQAYRNRREWKGIVHRALMKDFSWDTSAAAHIELCRKAIRTSRRTRLKQS